MERKEKLAKKKIFCWKKGKFWERKPTRGKKCHQRKWLRNMKIGWIIGNDQSHGNRSVECDLRLLMLGGGRRHKCDVDKNPPPTQLPPIKRDKNIRCQQQLGLVSEYAATMGAIGCSWMFSHFEPLVYFRNNRHSRREHCTGDLLNEPLLTNLSPGLLGSLHPCHPSRPIS